jgi:hypothetical protein
MSHLKMINNVRTFKKNTQVWQWQMDANNRYSEEDRILQVKVWRVLEAYGKVWMYKNV